MGAVVMKYAVGVGVVARAARGVLFLVPVF